MKPRNVHLGDVFGRLTVVELISGTASVPMRCLVRCSCGTEKSVTAKNLYRGSTTSCGCYRREGVVQRSYVHGHATRGRLSSEWIAWSSARERVTNPAYHGWRDYGGRGIRMAAEWLQDFPAFLAHIGPKPDPAYSLDRIDVNGDYEPGNVRWATASTQQTNKRSKKQIAADRRRPRDTPLNRDLMQPDFS